MKLNSPFEQFELIVLQRLVWNQIDISITNLTIALMLAIIFILSILCFVNYNIKLIPIRWQVMVEQIYNFIIGLIKDQAGQKGIKYFPIVFLLLMLILTLNLLGLIPYGYTVTSQLIVTFSLAFSLFLGLILIGFKEHGIKFLKLFVPSGIPNALLPLLVFIEVISYFLRPLSLSVRLGANMLAGHILLNIIGTATVFLLSVSLILGLIPWIFITLFMVLEVGIAFLQAYVFSILFCIYLYDSLHGGH